MVVVILVYLSFFSVRGGELFDKVTTIGKYDEKTSKILFYQMLLAVSVSNDVIINHCLFFNTSTALQLFEEYDGCLTCVIVVLLSLMQV